MSGTTRTLADLRDMLAQQATATTQGAAHESATLSMPAPPTLLSRLPVTFGAHALPVTRSAAVAGSLDALEASAYDPWVACLSPAHIGGLLVLLRGAFTGSRVSIERNSSSRLSPRCTT